MRKILLTAFAVILVSGCTPKLEADLYIADIYDVMENQIEAKVPATLFVPITSTKKCDEETNKIVPVLQKYSDFPIEAQGCVKNKGEIFDFLEIDVEMPIYNVNLEGEIFYGKKSFKELEESQPKHSALGAVVVRQMWTDSSALWVNLILNHQIDDLVAELDDKYPVQRVSLDNMKLTVNLLNDTRGSVEASIGGAFVNGEPTARATAFIIERRKDLEVVSSDARSASLIKNKFLSYAIISGRGDQLPQSHRVKPSLLGWSPID